MPQLNLQLQEGSSKFRAGESIRGDVLITTSNHVRAKQVKISFRGRFFTSREGYKLRRFGNSKELDRGHNYHSAGNQSHQESSQTSQRVNNETTRAGPIDFIEFQTEVTFDTPTLTNLHPGVNKVPFELMIPDVHDAILPNSAENPTFWIRYSLKATLSYYKPTFIGDISWSTSSSRLGVRLEQNLSPSSHLATSERVKTVTSKVVKEWDETSMEFGQLMRYAVGMKTHRQETAVETIFSAAKLIVIDSESPTYLQDQVSLKVRMLRDTTFPILVSKLRVTLTSITQIKCRDGDLFMSEKIDELLTASDLTADTAEFSCGEEEKTNPKFKESDITPLLSGLKLPGQVTSSTTGPDFDVSQKLTLTMSLRAGTPIGVKQVPTSVTMVLPIRIISGEQNED